MFRILAGVVVVVIGSVSLSSIYQNKILSQINSEMVNGDIDVNNVTFLPRNIVNDNMEMFEV